MKTENIPTIDAYQCEDDKIYVVEKQTIVDLLNEFGGLDKVPYEKAVNARRCYLESELGINSDWNNYVYRIGEETKIERISGLKAKQIRCSNFSVFE